MSSLAEKRLIVRLKEEFPSNISNITFLCEALEPTTLTNQALWRISRIVNLGAGRIQTTVAGRGLFDQVCDDRESLFPISPFINTVSTLFDGIDGEARGLPTGDPSGGEESLRFERTQPFSVSYIVRRTSATNTQTILDKQKAIDNTFKGWGVTCTAGKMRFVLRNNALTNNTLVVDGNLTTDINVWEHWVITYDGGSTAAGVNFYKNGAINPAPIAVIDNLSATTISDERFRIGRRSGPSIPFTGNIDQVTIWNKELSNIEAAEAYNIDFINGFDILNHSAALDIISHWRMGDSDIFPLVQDRKGVSDMTVINLDASAFVQEVP